MISSNPKTCLRSLKVILNFDNNLIKSVTFKKENESMLLDLIIQTIYYEIHNTNYLPFSICRYIFSGLQIISFNPY